MASSTADRNLLFGILALQNDFVTRDQLIEAMNAWVLEKQRSLADLFRARGIMGDAEIGMLQPLIERQLAKYGGDAEKSLAALSPPAAVCAQLKQIADADLHASLAQFAPTPTSYHDSLPTFTPPTPEAGRFQILRPHARGGLGEVFVAKDGELNREVALKEIQLRHADHPESRARFVREAEITGGLEHPGIVPVYALGHYADGPRSGSHDRHASVSSRSGPVPA